MIYRSNLTAPDLSSQFKLLDPPKMIMGHDAPSDPDYEPDCTFLTHDEAAILYNVAKLFPGDWVDIGARFGWTTAHISLAIYQGVFAVDPHFSDAPRLERFNGNTAYFLGTWPYAITANAFFTLGKGLFSGFMIDGNHDSPFPRNDAGNAMQCAAAKSVIVFHDFWGRPIREGIELCMERGWKCRVYNTPNGMAVCWRGDVEMPLHVPDPAIDWEAVRRSRAPEFVFGACV